MPTRLQRFVFPTNDPYLHADGFIIEDDVDDEGRTRRWIPINAESDPESNTVWVWAFLYEQ